MPVLSCIIGIGAFFVLNVSTTTFTLKYNFPQLHWIAQSLVNVVEGQVETGGGHEEDGEIHGSEEEHHEEGTESYSPLSPDKAKNYSSNKTITVTTPIIFQ